MELYDPSNQVWYSLKDLFLPRNSAYHGCIKHEGKVYLFSGFDGRKRFASLHVLDLQTLSWSLKSAMHQKRCFASAVLFEDKIYAFGGASSDQPETRLTTTECYSIGDNQWNLLCPMLAQRSDSAAAAWNDKIFVLGGMYVPVSKNAIN